MDLSSKLQVPEKNSIHRVDWNLVFVILALNFIGLVNLFSATTKPGIGLANSMFYSQIFWMSIGWIIFFVLTFLDYKIILRLAPVYYLFNLVALVLVLLVGHSSHKAQRWLDLGFMKYQPSETTKLALLLVLALLFANRKSNKPLSFLNLIKPGLLAAIPFVLTMKQPDLGTALLLLAITGTILIFIGLELKIIISSLLLVAITVPLLWNYGMKPYQKQRILTFINPAEDPRGVGYNSIQAKIAVGSGKIFGKGYRKGTQSQLEFLPERSTDFIFCVLSEEHGFVGGISVLGLFAILLTLILRIAALSKDRFGTIMCVGVGATLFWHMFVNIGMVIGLLPIVGVPLPLLSYGGTITMTAMVGLGLVSSVSYHRNFF